MKSAPPALYLETSYVLAWLFGETHSQKYNREVDAASAVATSVLTTMEVERGLLRALAQGRINIAENIKLLGMFRSVASGWLFIEISKTIREQVGNSFPIEPIRTLDAIHLATATMLLAAYPDLKILTLDQRVSANAKAMGLDLLA